VTICPDETGRTARRRGLVTETLARPRNVVVHEVRAKHASQVAFVEHDDEIEAFAGQPRQPEDEQTDRLLRWETRWMGGQRKAFLG
jgi:hypothetical protein